MAVVVVGISERSVQAVLNAVGVLVWAPSRYVHTTHIRTPTHRGETRDVCEWDLCVCRATADGRLRGQTDSMQGAGADTREALATLLRRFSLTAMGREGGLDAWLDRVFFLFGIGRVAWRF
jgi:hypothetical protein